PQVCARFSSVLTFLWGRASGPDEVLPGFSVHCGLLSFGTGDEPEIAPHHTPRRKGPVQCREADRWLRLVATNRHGRVCMCSEFVECPAATSGARTGPWRGSRSAHRVTCSDGPGRFQTLTRLLTGRSRGTDALGYRGSHPDDCED